MTGISVPDTTSPDGVEVVATHAEAERMPIPPLLVVEPVETFLHEHGLGSGPISWNRIGDGQSNITYAIRIDGRTLVLRRGPRPPLPRSAHDMVREARVQQLLGTAGVPVPRVLAVCDDESLLGVPFYVMEFLDGEVITDSVPPALDAPGQRAAISGAAVDSLVALHSVDVTVGELATLGRPDGYLARQVERFASLWGVNSRRSIPAVDVIAGWLADNRPTSQRASVVHGDYRIGNLMLARQAPIRIAAILDWEMATLGDPLADLGYLTATYAEEGSVRTPMELTPVTRLHGFLTRAQLVERYRESIPLDVSALPWYQTLALWKAAIFCEAMYTRWVMGEREGDRFAPTLEAGVPQLLANAAGFAGLDVAQLPR